MNKQNPTVSPNWSVEPVAGLQVNSVAISADGSRCVFGTSNEYGSGQFAVFCYDNEGTQRWTKTVGPAGSTQGVFWVAVSADGKYAAAGGELNKSSGFLTAYGVADGASQLHVATTSRVNQVALSSDGSSLLAVYDDTVQLYQLTSSGYTLASAQSFPGAYCNSCALSEDGATAIVSITIYADTGTSSTSTGEVVALSVSGGQLTVLGTWASPVGVMRVAITAGGGNWAASLHDGSCALFDTSHIAQPLWQYKPTQANLGIAYGVDITETSDGRVVIACGTNMPAQGQPGGYLYLVDSVEQQGVYGPQLRWGSALEYSANPGVCLDSEALLVTATDGQPESGSESPGNFYLFDGSSGTAVWDYPTSLMNWPMVITPDGANAFGGSDNGYVYYWKLQQK